jgi:hypothetical protein
MDPKAPLPSLCSQKPTWRKAAALAREWELNQLADRLEELAAARPYLPIGPPVILVAMEVFGLHEYIKDVARRLAKLGAFAVAPDYYFRKGDLTKVTETSQIMPLVNTKSDTIRPPNRRGSALTAGGRSTRRKARTTPRH